jgi:TolB protein
MQYGRLVGIFILGWGVWTTGLTAPIREIVIGGGQVSGIPVYVQPFVRANEENSESLDLAAVIRADLQSSGQFRSTAGTEAETLVKGHIHKTGMHRYTVGFELWDVLQKNMPTAKSPLLAMQFENIKPEAFRALAHHMSDHIFERLLGIKGFFSTRIAYVTAIYRGKGQATHTLEVADFDGYEPHVLKHSNYALMSPAWAPNGKFLAYVSFEKDRPGIHILDVKTGHSERVAQYPGINGAPAWSPDGRTLALVLSHEGSPKIYTLDLASKRLERVTEGAGIDTEPSWAPQGQAIFFTSNRGGKPQIYRVELLTRKITRVTFQGEYNTRPSITPDGKQLVVLHKTSDGRCNIAVQNLATGSLKILTDTNLNDSPSLAPNGMMVIYGTQEGNQGVLGAVSLDGRVKMRLPAREVNMQSPAWAPFVRGE